MRPASRPVYNDLIDDAVEREFHKPGREFRTFTLAVNAKDAQGQPVTLWRHRIVLTATYRKGDRVALTGFFKVQKYEKDGETKEVRELVVSNAKLERIKGPRAGRLIHSARPGALRRVDRTCASPGLASLTTS